MQSSIVQSIMFHRKFFTTDQARHWLIHHKFKANKVDITKNYYRFRQHEPSKKYYYRVKEVSPGILFVFAFPYRYS
jgi:hypothetical protein